MSEQFDIAVRINPGNVSTETKKIEGALDHLEAKAKQTRETMQAIGTIGLPDLPSKLDRIKGAFTQTLGAMGNVAPLIAAGAAVNAYFEELNHIKDEMTELSNKAQKFTTDFKDSNAVLAEMTELGAKLHSTAGNVIGGFDAIGDATDSLNLSTAEQIRLTELLGKGARLGGQSLDAIGNRMMALSVAFETGGDAGRQLRGLFRDFKDVGDDLAKTLGLTKQEIVDMASNGKLSYQQLVNALLNGGQTIEDGFKKVTKTHAEMEAQFTEGGHRAIAAGEELFTATMAGLDQMHGKLQEAAEDWGTFEDAMVSAAKVGKYTATRLPTASDISKQIGVERANEVETARLRLEGLTQAYEKGLTTKDLYRQESELLNQIINGTVAAYHKEAKAIEEVVRNIAVLRETRSATTPDMVQPMDLHLMAPEPEDLVDTFHPNYSPVGNTANVGAAESGFGAGSDFAISVTTAKDAHAEIARDAEEQAARTKEAWASAAGEMAASFIKAARDGSLSFDDLSSQIAKVALQMAAMQAGGPYGAFLSALVGGFAHGGSYTIPKSPDWFTMPHAAHGNSWEMGGGGGADDHMFMARVSSGERVDVLTRQQQLAESQFLGQAQRAMRSGGGSTKVTNQIVVRSDPREVTRAMGSYSGQREFVDLNRQFNRRR